MRFRCPTARVVGTGEIEGYKLLFKGSCSGSYLTRRKNNGLLPTNFSKTTKAYYREIGLEWEKEYKIKKM